MNLELLGNRQLKSTDDQSHFSFKGPERQIFSFLSERKGGRPFLKKLCLFLDWKVKESWRGIFREGVSWSKGVIPGQSACDESHMKKELSIKWLSYDTTVSLSQVGTGMRQCTNK